MTAPVLFIVGTPLGGWLASAAGLLASTDPGAASPQAFARWHDEVTGTDVASIAAVVRSRGADPARAEPSIRGLPPELDAEIARQGGAIDARACWTAEAMARQFPTARFVVVVEAPARAMAHWMDSGSPGAPADAVAVWTDGTRRLIALLSRHFPRCLVVDERDLRTRPAAVARRVAAWAGRPSIADAASPRAGHEPSPAQQWIGSLLVGPRTPAVAAHAELLASCVVLDDDDASSPDAPAAADEVDPGAAVDALREWSRLPDLCARVGEERDALRAQAARLSADLESAHDAAREARRESDALLLQLHEAQEGYEATYHRLVEAQRRAAHSDEVAGLKQRLSAVESERDAAVAGRRAAEAKLAEARGALDASQAAVTAGRREADLLLQQLDNVQQELEQCFLSWKTSTSRPAASGGLRIQSIEFGAERDTPPHRELAVSLREVRLRDGELPSLDVRLVEHHGHPGLAVFSTGAREAFSSWSPNGAEEGRDFMLLVPEDDAAARLIQRMPSTDWVVLTGLVDALAVALHNAPGVPSRWRTAAQRLRGLLRSLPDRLRYDELDVRLPADAQGVLEAEFRQVMHGSRAFDRVRLRWAPDAATGGQVQLVLPEGDDPPLLRWPVDEAGDWSPRFALPTGASAPTADRRRQWRALPSQDRELLLGLLDALPATAIAADALPPGVDRAGLTALAARPLRDALHALGGSRLRRIARAILRRGR